MKPKSIFIIAAMKSELLPLLNLFCVQHEVLKAGELLESTYDGVTIYWLITGVGRRQVYRRLNKYISIIESSTISIFTGSCGAVASSLRVGDVIVASHVIAAGENELSAENCVPPINDHRLPVWVSGMLYTADQLMMYADKKNVGATFPTVQGVDMEAFYILEYYCRHNKKLIVIKTVSDTLTSRLPSEAFIRSKRSMHSLVKKVIYQCMHPINACRLKRLNKSLAAAMKINAKFVKAIFDNML